MVSNPIIELGFPQDGTGVVTIDGVISLYITPRDIVYRCVLYDFRAAWISAFYCPRK